MHLIKTELQTHVSIYTTYIYTKLLRQHLADETTFNVTLTLT